MGERVVIWEIIEARGSACVDVKGGKGGNKQRVVA